VLTGYWYVTDLVGSFNKSKEHAIRSYKEKPKNRDKQQKAVERLAHMGGIIQGLLSNHSPDYVGIEDYALREEQGAHQLGEIGGIARLMCHLLPTRLRLHDPMTVKMFGAWDGSCSKEYMRQLCIKRWNLQEFEECDQPLSKPNKRVTNPKPNYQTSGDLVDAYTVAKMVWAEVQIRMGTKTLADLENDKERRVFLRVTKTYAVNLLEREWICAESLK
jgi:Holliday junction resolvasome RuvABC endonuclease subunit